MAKSWSTEISGGDVKCLKVPYLIECVHVSSDSIIPLISITQGKRNQCLQNDLYKNVL